MAFLVYILIQNLYERRSALLLARAFIADDGATAALKLPTVSLTAFSDPRFHRFVVALPTNITTESDPEGMVAFTSAVRGISAFVDCDRLLNTISK